MFAASISNTSGTATVAQIAGTTSAGSNNRIRVTTGTADTTVSAGELGYILTRIEGTRSLDLCFGTARAKTVTLQFGVKAPAGTYCVTLTNSAGNRSYVSEYVISSGEANTDVIKSITVVGDTSGTWLMDTNTGIQVSWGLMVGTTYQQTAGSWGTVNAFGSINQFNIMGTVGNIFELFDVSLTEGTVAPPFQVPDYASELALCSRYFQNLTSTSGHFGIGQAISTVRAMISVAFPGGPMRASPTLVSPPGTYLLWGSGAGGLALTAQPVLNTVDPTKCWLDTSVASGLVAGNATYLIASATQSLSFSARL